MLHISLRFSLLLEIFSMMKFYNFFLIDTDYRWSSHILDDDCIQHTTRFYEKFESSLSIKICEICLMQRNTSKSCKLSFTLNTANLTSCREGNWFCYEQSFSQKHQARSKAFFPQIMLALADVEIETLFKITHIHMLKWVVELSWTSFWWLLIWLTLRYP